MHVVMKIVGTVVRLADSPWDYSNNARPLALGLGGFATCEVVLSDPDGLITTTPQLAELHFLRVVQFEDTVVEINLFDGQKLIMKFRPLGVTDVPDIG